MDGDRVLIWYSCGAASAVAAKMAINKYASRLPIYIAYCDTGAEHKDNVRFLADCAKWYGHKIHVLKSEKYSDIWEVYEKRRYIVGVRGAPCTYEMKMKVREQVQRPTDIQVFGFTSEETNRATRFDANHPDVYAVYPLIDKGISKSECYTIIQKAGITLPKMYRMGYRNNNCVPCCKGQQGYWNKIRVDFPAEFERMAKLERDIGAAINKTYKGGPRTPVYLDELDPDAGRYKDENISCGFDCLTTL